MMWGSSAVIPIEPSDPYGQGRERDGIAFNVDTGCGESGAQVSWLLEVAEDS